MRVPVMTPPPDRMPSPTGLATRLHTLPCALLFNRHGPLSLVRLIEKSRHLLQCTSNSLQFWAGCSCSLAFLQLLALVAMLPPVLHTGDVLWLALVCLPLLSLSLQASPHNPEVMSQATGKNKLVPHSQLLRFVAAHYGSKFLPSLLVLICCAALALRGMCTQQVTTPAMLDDRSILNGTVEPSSSRNYDNDRRAALGSDAFRMPIIATSGSMDEYNRSSPNELPLDTDKHSTLFVLSKDDKMPLVATPTMEGMMFDRKATHSNNKTAFGNKNPPFKEVFLKPPPLHKAPVATFSVAECFYVYQKRHVNIGVPRFLWTGWGPHYAESVRAVQVFTTFLVLLYFCIISISFVHRMGQVWKKNPFLNRVWAVTVPSLLLLQLAYSSLVCSFSAPQGMSSVPLQAWLVALTWGLLLLPVNELLKRREIRANKRYLKKARLEFGTKLGMNSPF